MTYQIDIQNTLIKPLSISEVKMKEYTRLTLQSQIPSAEVTIRIVDIPEIQKLNATYRKKDKPTNVLAFPTQLPKDIFNELELPYIGDVVICADVIALESIEQNKSLEAHWAHILIHGVLHLLGHDHIDKEDEHKMQKIEIELLHLIGFNNPYEDEGNGIID